VAGPRWRRAKPGQIATDLVDRAFTRTGPDQLWITDITELVLPRPATFCAARGQVIRSGRSSSGRSQRRAGLA
jgi:hypothetical protein